MTYDDILNALSSIRVCLDQPATDVHEQSAKLTELTILTGLAAECEAKASALYNKRLSDEIVKIIYNEHGEPRKGIHASLVKPDAEGKAAVYFELSEYSRKINTAITNSINAIRTQISFTKTEMENSLAQSRVQSFNR
jgi:hypothetical protein